MKVRLSIQRIRVLSFLRLWDYFSTKRLKGGEKKCKGKPTKILKSSITMKANTI